MGASFPAAQSRLERTTMAGNPFHDLYLSEAISENELVDLFSPVIVEHSGVVFESGNVIVQGLQGTGKTMLLNLLRPDTRLAYRRANTPFPVPDSMSKFISAGINLRKCGVLEFAQHLERGAEPRRVQDLALLFADFVNYWVVADLLATIRRFASSGDEALLKQIGLSVLKEQLDAFSSKHARDACWFGALDAVNSLEDLTKGLEQRIANYRRFLNLNIQALPGGFVETKTVIGEPILKCVEALKNAGVVAADTKVFVRIDQYEQLDTLNVVGTNYGTSCKQLIHKALGARDARVSYRIGTRTHGWDARPLIYRTTDALELKRDFDLINMEEIFRRRENSRTWLFPRFATDIFARRMKVSEYSKRRGGPELSMNATLGKSLVPQARANAYVPSIDGRRQIVRRLTATLHKEAPEAWVEYVVNLADVDLLNAVLASAWVRQKVIPKRQTTSTIEDSLPEVGKMPWSGKPYWYKERVQLGLMQVASMNRQALLWSGEDDVLSLGGGQILVFLFLVQHIWDAWLRDRRGDRDATLQFPIRPEVQSQGVLEASIEWRYKQAEGLRSQERKAFVDALGQHFYITLTDDKAMSYPGANGFSVENGELERSPEIRDFLRNAVSYGDLYESAHTSKKKGERRTKYYLAPILSPFFRIPIVRTKEPLYVSVQQVRIWMGDKSATAEQPSSTAPLRQPSLWDEKRND